MQMVSDDYFDQLVTIEEAARMFGVTVRTAHNWKIQPEDDKPYGRTVYTRLAVMKAERAARLNARRPIERPLIIAS